MGSEWYTFAEVDTGDVGDYRLVYIRFQHGRRFLIECSCHDYKTLMQMVQAKGNGILARQTMKTVAGWGKWAKAERLKLKQAKKQDKEKIGNPPPQTQFKRSHGTLSAMTDATNDPPLGRRRLIERFARESERCIR